MAGKTENFIIFQRTNFDITRLKQGFYEISSFAIVIGAIDGTYIQILAPHIGEEAYVNQKAYNSINFQTVMNQDYVKTQGRIQLLSKVGIHIRHSITRVEKKNWG